MTIEEFVAAVNKRQPPAPEQRIRGFEARIGASLPDDYRQFLAACNGGSVGGAFWYKGPTPDGRHAEAGVHHIGGLRDESHFSLEWKRAIYQEKTEVRIPLDLLWIMGDPFGNAICLGIRAEHRGRVYFWDHEAEPDSAKWDGSVAAAPNITLLANGFTEFVAGLRPLDE
jgi:hypothetical protein